MKSLKFAVAALAAAVLSGCATQPEIPFDKSVNTNIRTIGILTPAMPEKPTVWLASDIGQSFGLVGALIDAGMQDARDRKVWAMLIDRKVSPRDDFLQALQDSLRAQGYEPKLIPVARKGADYVKVYPTASETGADAYLDIAIGNYGYVAAGTGRSTPYRPFVYLNCKLVRASNGEVLMQDSVFYDPVAPFGQGKNVSISPDPAYTFVDFDTMEGAPDKVVSGIDASLHQTSDAVGRLLR